MVKPISVQIVTFNEEKNIASCLIHIQKNSPEEIVVIDCGSKDHTVEIALRFGAKVMVFPNTGRGFRRLQGVRSSNCKYIAFVDADDRIPEDWLSRMRTELDKGSFSALQSSLRVKDDKNRLSQGWNNYFIESIKPSNDSIMVGRPALYLRESISDPNLKVGHYAEDTEFSKFLFDHNFRQGISEITSFREVPTSWRINFKKWRGYGRGYSDFLQSHPGRRPAILFHIFVRIPLIRGMASTIKGHPFSILFNILMSFHILIGLIRTEFFALIRRKNENPFL